MHTKIYSSDSDKKIGGVIGGIAEHFDIDPTLLRLLAIFVTLVTGIIPGIITYLFALIIMPTRHEDGLHPHHPPKSVVEEKRRIDEEERGAVHSKAPGEGADEIRVNKSI